MVKNGKKGKNGKIKRVFTGIGARISGMRSRAEMQAEERRKKQIESLKKQREVLKARADVEAQRRRLQTTRRPSPSFANVGRGLSGGLVGDNGDPLVLPARRSTRPRKRR
jgi:hypothetical protein